MSEPISEYIRYEHFITGALNIAAGEDVRWLPRRSASDLLVPGNDSWLFDDRIVMWNFFNGDGEATGREITEDPAIADLCRSAFAGVWERATPQATNSSTAFEFRRRVKIVGARRSSCESMTS